eukprot:CAMPEP_0168626734 /NCGR_PEP_ID=MMETSP0449_2-20121227/10806_1 /TAXON_ID=1082188 /ORGANISM="Strombidium rassoulzadegani, Strain ras09" /LENGTH=43 /DNA_ID= /DNA_START= /DNA_END= /DNA_ORIENTATION=
MTKIKFDEEEFEKWFTMADVDNDQQITFDEALGFVNKFMLGNK